MAIKPKQENFSFGTGSARERLELADRILRLSVAWGHHHKTRFRPACVSSIALIRPWQRSVRDPSFSNCIATKQRGGL